MNGSFSSLLNFQKPIIIHPSSLPSFLFLSTLTKTSSSSLITKSQLQDSNNETSSSNEAKKASGFGTNSDPIKKNKSKSKERSNIIRRTPIEKPSATYSVGKVEDEGTNSVANVSVTENAFLLTWLGLGLLIFVEGIALAASGFLPEEWDKFLVQYLYPSFTPTVFLFVGGTVVYGVIKYLEGEKMKS